MSHVPDSWEENESTTRARLKNDVPPMAAVSPIGSLPVADFAVPEAVRRRGQGSDGSGPSMRLRHLHCALQGRLSTRANSRT